MLEARSGDGGISVGAVKRLNWREAAERNRNAHGWSSDESAETEMERIRAGRTQKMKTATGRERVGGIGRGGMRRRKGGWDEERPGEWSSSESSSGFSSAQESEEEDGVAPRASL